MIGLHLSADVRSEVLPAMTCPSLFTSDVMQDGMLEHVQDFVRQLNARGIRYCHWKSNLALREALSGQTDIDVLVDRHDADAFRSVCAQNGFRPTRPARGNPLPSMEHSYALDPATGTLVHLHAYLRVLTGESLAKNLRLPIEDLLLQHTRTIAGMPVPDQSAELVVFTVRMMLKHTSVAELWLLGREAGRVREELAWLRPADSLPRAVDLVRQSLPTLDPDLFTQCIGALGGQCSLPRRIVLGRRVRAQLRPYARHSRVGAAASGAATFAGLALRRLHRSERGMVPASGGAVIAFVGPEATGKSTLLSASSRWLGEHFAVSRVHAGKPPSTWLTLVPNVAVPALRALLPGTRTGSIEARYAVPTREHAAAQKPYPLMFAVRSVLLAYDRRRLLTRAFARAANGRIVLCDRYPSLEPGAPDSPQLAHLSLPEGRYPFRRFLARTEAALYRGIPPADLVLSLRVPLEVALMRNRDRGKEEPEAYVRRRHARATAADFGPAPVRVIQTDRPLDVTLLEIKRTIWDAL